MNKSSLLWKITTTDTTFTAVLRQNKTHDTPTSDSTDPSTLRTDLSKDYKHWVKDAKRTARFQTRCLLEAASVNRVEHRDTTKFTSDEVHDKESRLLPPIVLMVHTADAPRGRPAHQPSDFRKLNTNYTTWRHSVRTLGDFPIPFETCWWYLLVYAPFLKHITKLYNFLCSISHLSNKF